MQALSETEAALKAAIKADPLVLVARGAYADWLTENGREHEIKRWYWTTMDNEKIETKNLNDRHLWNILQHVTIYLHRECRISDLDKAIERIARRATGVILEAERRRFPWRERIPIWIREEANPSRRRRYRPLV